MNTDILTTKVSEGIAVITLGSAKRIYFNAEMGDALTEALEQFAGDPKVRVVVITGGAPGYFNRHFDVDVLARRIASFDRRPIAAAKNLINQVSLPSADRLLDAMKAFLTALTWPETLERVQSSVQARTPAGRRLRKAVALGARHAPRGEEMNTFTTKDGTVIYYKDWGKGPVVTFSHGWPLSADAWDAQMLFLAQRARTVSPNPVGEDDARLSCI